MKWHYRLHKVKGWWWIERAAWGLWLWPFMQIRKYDSAPTIKPKWSLMLDYDFKYLSAWPSRESAKDNLRKILEHRDESEEIVYIRVDEVAA